MRAVFAQDPPVVPVVAGVDVGEVFGFGGGPAQDGFTVDGPDEDLPGTGTTFEDDRLADGTYYYTAFAVDTNGNWSEAATASARARYLTRAPP